MFKVPKSVLAHVKLFHYFLQCGLFRKHCEFDFRRRNFSKVSKDWWDASTHCVCVRVSVCVLLIWLTFGLVFSDPAGIICIKMWDFFHWNLFYFELSYELVSVSVSELPAVAPVKHNAWTSCWLVTKSSGPLTKCSYDQWTHSLSMFMHML